MPWRSRVAPPLRKTTWRPRKSCGWSSSKRFDEAEALARDVSTRSPSLGHAHWQRGETKKAAAAFRRALEARALEDTAKQFDSEGMALKRAQSEAAEIHPIMSLERELGPTSDSLGLLTPLERKGSVLERQAGIMASFRREAQDGRTGTTFAALPAEQREAYRVSDAKLVGEYEQASRRPARRGAAPGAAGAAQEAGHSGALLLGRLHFLGQRRAAAVSKQEKQDAHLARWAFVIPGCPP